MSENNNILGMNGFIWWIGVIENRKDPMKLGRCQIRIFGWHTENKAQLPTKDLPWAQTLLPMNQSRTMNPPELGDWVVGFFLDGESAQFPIMMGVLPGFTPSKDDLTSFNNVTVT